MIDACGKVINLRTVSIANPSEIYIMSKNKEIKMKKKEIYKSVAPFLNLGLQLAITILICILIGVWLDEKFATSPLWTLILAAIGIFGAFYSFIRKMIDLEKKEK